MDFTIGRIEAPPTANGTFLRGCEAHSPRNVARRLARVVARSARLLRVPQTVLAAAADLREQRDFAQRLLGTPPVDSAKARRLLRWGPAITVDERLSLAMAAL